MYKTFFACSTLLALASVAPVRSAQIAVTVGGNGIIAYSPNNVTANVGDTVIFTFQQKNHTGE
jgi:plastocyanin